jgi:mRNA interferase MazF
MDMKRGNLVTVALQGDYGKPRPAMVVQSDLFSEHPSVTVLPITSELRPNLLFRIDLQPNPFNGLQKSSQVMIDKITTVSRDKVGNVFGELEHDNLMAINRAVMIFLGLA